MQLTLFCVTLTGAYLVCGVFAAKTVSVGIRFTALALALHLSVLYSCMMSVLNATSAGFQPTLFSNWSSALNLINNSRHLTFEYWKALWSKVSPLLSCMLG